MRWEDSIEINAAPERVWRVMSDVERWHEWTASISSIELLDGSPIAVGRRARVRQPKLPVAVWRVTRLEPERGFVWQSKSPIMDTVAGHEIEPLADGGVRVRLWLEQRGLLAPFGFLWNGLTRRYLRLEVEGLKRRSEGGG